MSENKHTPVAYSIYICGEPCDVYLDKEFATMEFDRRNAKYPDSSRALVSLYPAETVEQLESENAALRKQRDELLAVLEEVKGLTTATAAPIIEAAIAKGGAATAKEK